MRISFQWLSLWHRIPIATKTPSQLRLPQGDLERQHEMAARWLPSGRCQRSSANTIRATRAERSFEYVGVGYTGSGSSERRGLWVAPSRERERRDLDEAATGRALRGYFRGSLTGRDLPGPLNSSLRGVRV